MSKNPQNSPYFPGRAAHRLRIAPESQPELPNVQVPALADVRDRLVRERARVEGLLAQQPRRRQRKSNRRRATSRLESRAATIAAALEQSRQVYRVEIAVPPLQPGEYSAANVDQALGEAAAAGVTVRLRGQTLVTERSGVPIPGRVRAALTQCAAGIDLLIRLTPCSACRRPSGRVEPASRRATRPWRITCHRCRRQLRIRD